MAVRVVIALVLLLAAGGVAWQLNRRRPGPPTRDAYPVPRQLDRADFTRPDAPWLVVLFSSATCDSCAAMAPKLRVLESDRVAVCEVEFGAQPELHTRYEIAGVPTTVVADADGVVRNGWVGPVSAADLWTAMPIAPPTTSEGSEPRGRQGGA